MAVRAGNRPMERSTIRLCGARRDTGEERHLPFKVSSTRGHENDDDNAHASRRHPVAVPVRLLGRMETC